MRRWKHLRVLFAVYAIPFCASFIWGFLRPLELLVSYPERLWGAQKRFFDFWAGSGNFSAIFKPNPDFIPTKSANLENFHPGKNGPISENHISVRHLYSGVLFTCAFSINDISSKECICWWNFGRFLTSSGAVFCIKWGLKKAEVGPSKSRSHTVLPVLTACSYVPLRL